MRIRTTQPRLLSMVCAAAALCSGTAQAQLSPYYFRLSETLSYDSNYFREPVIQRKEAISTTALSVGLDQPIGRQRLFGDATVRGVVHKEYTDLNGVGYDLRGGVDWELGNKLSGTLAANFGRAQADFSSYGANTGRVRERNDERSTSIDFRGQYGGQSVLSLVGLANYTRVRYSLASFNSSNRQSHMVGAGVRYRPSAFWSFGLTGRRTNGEYPQALDEYDRTDIDLTADYQPTGLSRFTARLSHTDEEHDLTSSRDFSGLTGELAWIYQVSGKVQLRTSVARETGSGTSISALSTAPVTSAPPTTGGTDSVPPPQPTPVPTSTTPVSYLTDSQLTDRFGIQADWAATGKITASAAFNYTNDDYDTQFGPSGGGGTSGHTRQYVVSANYAATRVWNFACGAGYEKRTTDALVTTSRGIVPYGYSATTAFCSAALSLR
jgi:hypothetical protein